MRKKQKVFKKKRTELLVYTIVFVLLKILSLDLVINC